MESKICIACWNEYFKPLYNRSLKIWIKRKYCSNKCSSIWQKWIKKTPEQVINMKSTFIKWHIPWNKGIKYTDEQKQNINIQWLIDNWWWRKWSISSEETRKKISIWNKWKKISEETRKKLSEYNKKIWKHPIWKYKEQHWNWRWWITPINTALRKSIEWRKWRIKVFERDNYTCMFCWIKSIKWQYTRLEADHIKPFALFPELRFDINNWRTLCVECHSKTETYKKSLRQLKILFNLK